MAKKKSRYSTNYIDYPGVGIITDEDVAKFVKQHTHWWDRLNYHKMTDSAIEAQLFLMKVVKPPKKKKWFLGEEEGS